MGNSKEIVQFDELEGELDLLMTEMASAFFKVDPAQQVGEVTIEMAEAFAEPFALKFIERLTALEMDFNAVIVREEFTCIIDEFDTVDRAVYAKNRRAGADAGNCRPRRGAQDQNHATPSREGRRLRGIICPSN